MDNVIFNQRLKFTWANIITLLAIIIAAYFSFVGFSYLSAGNFVFAGIGAAVCVVVLAVVFITAQQLKASGKKMSRKIVWERILIFGSPLVVILTMIPMVHFWTVHAERENAVNLFTETINNSRQIFDDYDEYTEKRLQNYSKTLNKVIRNAYQKEEDFVKAGFSRDLLTEKLSPTIKNRIRQQKANMMETLRLQLQSPNVNNLKKSALKWIDDANTGASVWNVFLIGNLDEISDAINGWESQLRDFTDKKMSGEELYHYVEPFSSHAAATADYNIDSLRSLFKDAHFPTIMAIIFGIILYLMLLFPYLIQDRHTKSTLRLFGNEKQAGGPVFGETATKAQSTDAGREPQGTEKEDDYMIF